jgi:CCR4-NOT transcription complex subunit 7/8
VENYDSSWPKEQREYSRIKANVDILKIIQLGITLSDGNGRMPSPISTWQFNFDYNLDEEKFNQSSIDLLKKHGIEFKQLRQHGINPFYFAEKLMTSGLVLNDKLTWICFHGCSDFGYFIRLLTNEPLPANRDTFNKVLRVYFPNLLDIKSFLHIFSLDGGLQMLANTLGIARQGTQHQAGSDSQVTLEVFFALFNSLESGKSSRDLQDVKDMHNLDVYGYSNDQAYQSFPSRSAPINVYASQSESSSTHVNEPV